LLFFLSPHLLVHPLGRFPLLFTERLLRELSTS